MSNGPWPAPSDKGGSTFVTVAGVRYRVEGTGYPYSQLTRSIRDGLAAIVGDDETGKGDG